MANAVVIEIDLAKSEQTVLRLEAQQARVERDLALDQLIDARKALAAERRYSGGLEARLDELEALVGQLTGRPA